MTLPSPPVPAPPDPPTTPDPPASPDSPATPGPKPSSRTAEPSPPVPAAGSIPPAPAAEADASTPVGGPLPPPPGPPPAWLPMLDRALRVLAGLLAGVAAVLSGVLELLLATVRVGGHLIGVSVLLAVVVNAALSWFAHRAVGAGWAVAIPAVAWFGLMVVAADRTAEGDVLLAGNWVGLVMIVAGSMAFAVVGFRLILDPRR